MGHEQSKPMVNKKKVHRKVKKDVVFNHPPSAPKNDSFPNRHHRSMICRSTPRFQWMWKANSDAWTTTEADEWKNFSDVENIIIEDAFNGNKDIAYLDDYHIIISGNVQVNNNDANKQRLVKRIKIGELDDRSLRQSRFMSNPITLKASFKTEHVLTTESLFIRAASFQFDIFQFKLSEIVERAAQGLIMEGKLWGKKREAEWMAKQLMKVRNKNLNDVGECCVHLYTMESFLCQKLNETMRLVADKEYERVWKNKLETLGPFAILLERYIAETKSGESIVVYRGAELTDEMIESYRVFTNNKRSYSDDNAMTPSFPAFTSCSRNRKKAEEFGNVLFIIDLPLRKSIDVSNLSLYPDEEEELIQPGVLFLVEQLDYDLEFNKYLIYLSVI